MSPPGLPERARRRAFTAAAATLLTAGAAAHLAGTGPAPSAAPRPPAAPPSAVAPPPPASPPAGLRDQPRTAQRAGLRAARAFLPAFLAVEVGHSGERVRRRLAATSSPGLASALRQPVRQPPEGGSPPRAHLARLTSNPDPEGDGMEVVAHLRRAGRPSVLVLRLRRDRHGWRVHRITA